MESLTSLLRRSVTVDKDPSSLKYIEDINGGLVNKAALFQSTTSKYFIKYNEDNNTESMFHSERTSLELLKQLKIIKVPNSYEIISLSDNNGCIHILEYIDNLKPVCNFWSTLGDKIGQLHTFNSNLLTKQEKEATRIHKSEHAEDEILAPVTQFGFHCPPYLGTFTPGDVRRNTWQEYFLVHLLGALFQKIEEKFADREIMEQWSEISLNVHKLFEGFNSIPELLHGDLCVANIGETNHEPVLFDPSCMYGDPEFDLIIPMFEEAFPEEFFASYRKICPKRPGYDKRFKAYKLFYYVIMFYFIHEPKYKICLHESLKEIQNILKSI